MSSYRSSLYKKYKSGLGLLKQESKMGRVRAVFLCLILQLSLFLASYVPWYSARVSAAPKMVSALATDKQNKKEQGTGIVGKSLDTTLKQFSPGVNEPKKGDFVKKELTEKRDRFKDVQQNDDGTQTEKTYMAPKYFEKNNIWQPIDTTLIEDTNAAGSGAVGSLLGQVQSLFKSPTTYKVKDNDWQARFAPSDDKNGMIRVQYGNDTLVFKPTAAKSVAPVISYDTDGKQVVHYYDLWPGVNVEYHCSSKQPVQFA